MYVVTGGSGLLGHAFKKILKNASFPERREVDLTSTEAFDEYIRATAPGVVIHLAAKVGGVKANMENMFDFYQINSNINNNVVSSCVKNRVPKLISCLSTCVYPDQTHISYPLTESKLHLGPPHESNYGYAYAKRMLDVQTQAAREQHGLEYITVIPNNLYGEGDNFDLNDSHVIPALIRKIWEAKISGQPYFEVWGDGEVFREFTYAEDIAKIMVFCEENYKEKQPINIGNTKEYKLKDVVFLLKEILEYEGEVVFDTSKPKGQIRKPSSNQKLLDLGWRDEWYTPLEKGLKKTCNWFINKYPQVRGIS